MYLTVHFPASPQKQETKPTLWSNAGLDIDVDNLLSTPKTKVSTTVAAPSMNQLASGIGDGGGTKQSTVVMGATSPSSSVLGVNYNVNTSMLASPPQRGQPLGMGRGVAPGMGMQPSGGMMMGQMGMGPAGFGTGMGMNYGASGGMGYGMGVRPGFGVGFGGQPLMGGYGSGPMNPMGMGLQQQHQQRPF